MANGVDLLSIKVTDIASDKTTLEVEISIAGDSEFAAIGWLINRLDES